MRKMLVRVGSRESRLAVIQSQIIMDQIHVNHRELELELVTMKTAGDMILNKALDQIGGKGLFVKELDQALMDGKIDLSVHSLKDMPMEVPKELPILAYSGREDARDALILRSGLETLPDSPVIGTSSKRRSLQASRLHRGVKIKMVRGNVQTRLKKLDDGEYDALILAAAGLKRLGLEGRISRYYSVSEMIPAAGQGILAVQGRQGEPYEYIACVHSLDARDMAVAERAFVNELGGGCSSPVAASAMVEGRRLSLRGLCWREEDDSFVTGTMEGSREEAEAIGIALALQLRRKLLD